MPNPNPQLLPGRDVKSLPHEYRVHDVPYRTDMVAKYNLDRKIRPSISDMANDSMSHNCYDRPLDYYEARPYRGSCKIGSCREGFLGGGELFTNEMLLLFMLIIFVVLGMYLWKTTSDLKHLIKSLMQNNGLGKGSVVE